LRAIDVSPFSRSVAMVYVNAQMGVWTHKEIILGGSTG
jgi:hypothetical protein